MMHFRRAVSVLFVAVIVSPSWVTPAVAADGQDPSSVLELAGVDDLGLARIGGDPGPDGGVSYSGGASTISLPASAAGDISIASASEELSVSIPRPTVSGDLDTTGRFPTYDAGDSATVPTVTRSGDLQILTVIDGPGAPESFDFSLTLPADSAIILGDNGGALIVNSDEAVLFSIAPPWAEDAKGNAVETSYTVNGNKLTQVVAHRDTGASYPIIADPKFAWAGVLPSVQLTRAETSALRGAGATAAGKATNACRGFVSVAGPAGGVLCGLNIISIMYNATRIYNEGKCAQLLIGPGVISTIGYRGGYCR